jgi:hypothetical protein
VALDRQNVSTLTVRFRQPQLGDAICDASDCKLGVDAVTKLIDFYNKVGRPPEFNAQVDEIVRHTQALVGSFPKVQGGIFWKVVERSSLCCQLKDAGRQADDLAESIAAATGTKAPPRTVPRTLIQKVEHLPEQLTKQREETQKLTTTGKVLIGVVGALGVGLLVYAVARRPRRAR